MRARLRAVAVLGTFAVLLGAAPAYGSATWLPPAELSAAACVCGVPAAASDAAGDVTVAFRDDTLGLAVTRHPAGGTWSSPVGVGPMADPVMAGNAAGDTVIAYVNGFDVNVVVDTAGEPWSAAATSTVIHRRRARACPTQPAPGSSATDHRPAGARNARAGTVTAPSPRTTFGRQRARRRRASRDPAPLRPHPRRRRLEHARDDVSSAPAPPHDPADARRPPARSRSTSRQARRLTTVRRSCLRSGLATIGPAQGLRRYQDRVPAGAKLIRPRPRRRAGSSPLPPANRLLHGHRSRGCLRPLGHPSAAFHDHGLTRGTRLGSPRHCALPACSQSAERI